jgi:hypothetical protein
MDDTYMASPGLLVDPENLRIPKARETTRALLSQALYWVRFVECRQVAESDESIDLQLRGVEVVVFDVEVEVPQRPVNAIRKTERIAVAFRAEDKGYPEILALRQDFPLVPHTNLRPWEKPRSLCLYDQPYSEIKLRWTAPSFVEHIRTWLARTAAGTLHEADQQLEPLLLGSATPIVIPANLLSASDEVGPRRLTISRLNNGPNRFCLVAENSTEANHTAADRTAPEFVATVIVGAPQAHGVIRKQPINIRELHQFLESDDVDLLSLLRERLRAWQQNKAIMRASLVILLLLPKTREDGGPQEDLDVWAFLCTSTSLKETKEVTARRGTKMAGFPSVQEIGEHLGLWVSDGGNLGLLILTDTGRQGEEISIALLNPVFNLSREAAARFNGFAGCDDRKITAVGLGALGSQVFLNLLRAAYGKWSLIDRDFMLPHNLARHGLYGNVIGWSKVEPLTLYANSMFDGEPIASAIVADVLDPEEMTAQVSQSLAEAEVIFDFSASIAVARHLAQDIKSAARRASLFLNPAGTDLVLLMEDAERKLPLTVLEMQYYRALTQDAQLRGHLHLNGSPIRYAHSCRDLSSTISQEHVALHAAIGSGALRRALSDPAAVIAFWRASDDGSVRSLKLSSAPMRTYRAGEWTICTDDYVLEKVRRERDERLPSETGGVLIGAFDMQHKVVYVVDTLPSPPDSKEQPTGYTRGFEGLHEKVEEIEKIVGGNLRYAGEWHSHPPGHDCAPSRNYDRPLFEWLAGKMAVDGLPPLMLIVGDHERHAWYLGTLP